MRLSLVTPPTEEPVTLVAAKLFLRIGQSDEDTTIEAMIGAARELCELHTARSFVSTTWDLYLDAWPDYEHDRLIMVPRADLISVTAITYLDDNGDEQTLDPSLYRVSTGPAGRIKQVHGETWPSLRSESDAVKVRFVAGYGDAAAVPLAIKQAVLLMTAHMNENRGDESAEIPLTVAHLLSTANWGPFF